MAWWQPDPSNLEQLVNLLAGGQRADVNQQALLDQLSIHKGNPDFNNYLAYIFCTDAIRDISVRTSAALLLKNNVFDVFKHKTAGLNVAYIQQSCLPMLRSESRALRQAAGTLVAAVLSGVPLEKWPELVQHILDTLDRGSPAVQEGTLSMLYKISEDFAYQLEVKVAALDAKPSNLIMPRVAALFSAENADVKHAAVRAFNIMSQSMPDWLVDNLDAYAQGLLRLAHENGEPRLQKEVCIGITQLLQARPDALEPQLPLYLAFIMHAMQHTEQEVALEAMEFWIQYMECQLPSEPLLPILGKLVSLLLTFMVYDEYDDEVADAEAAETAQTDADSVLRPFIGRSDSNAGPEGDDSSSGGDGAAADTGYEWTLRKSCAQTLDHLSHEFPDRLLDYVLPVVERYLNDDNWRLREAAILALGAVAEGCSGGLAPHIPSILVMLMSKLKDPQPMVRINSCWTLGRFSRWALDTTPATPDAIAKSPYVLQIVNALLERTREHNSCVHFAACSGLSAFFEMVRTAKMGSLLDGEAAAITAQLVACMPRYTRKNVRSLYEAIVELVSAVPACVTNPELVRSYMEPLVARLVKMHALDREINPLIDALILLSSLLGPHLEPYAPTLLQRALTICAEGLAVANIGAVNGATPTMQDAADAASSVMTYALDLISGLCETLKLSMQGLLATVGGAAVADLAVECARGKTHAVRQSAFALIGDLATYCCSFLQPRGGDLLQLCSDHIDFARITEDEMNACNNACWSLGLLIQNLPKDLSAPYILLAAERCTAVLRGQDMVHKRMFENAAISLGYIAFVAPAQLAPHLEQFLGQWLANLRTVRDGPEKEAAFQGLLAVLSCNPAPGLRCFTSLSSAVGSWQTPPPGLRPGLQSMMSSYKAQLESVGQWATALETLSTTCSKALMDRLKSEYAF